MSMNIKNEETHRMAQELAALTGESMTVAVTEAVRERLHRVKKQSVKEKIMRIAKECAPLWKEPYKSMNIDDLLYDEKGLPK